MPRPRRGCAGVAASSLRERGQSTRHSPKQSPSLPRACLKIAAWAHLGAVGEAALFFLVAILKTHTRTGASNVRPFRGVNVHTAASPH